MHHHHGYILQDSTCLRNPRARPHSADASAAEAYMGKAAQWDKIKTLAKSGFLVCNIDFGHEFKPVGSTDIDKAQGHRFSLPRKR